MCTKMEHLQLISKEKTQSRFNNYWTNDKHTYRLRHTSEKEQMQKVYCMDDRREGRSEEERGEREQKVWGLFQ